VTERNAVGKFETHYTPELGARICDEISDGKTLPEVCAMDGMPCKRAVFGWVRSNPEFERMYRIAQQDRAEGLVEEIVSIADDSSRDFVPDKDGNMRVDNEHINRARLKVDTRKWIACKVIPKLYGDKLEINGEIRQRDVSDQPLTTEEWEDRYGTGVATTPKH
jgi:hypothetical protein